MTITRRPLMLSSVVAALVLAVGAAGAQPTGKVTVVTSFSKDVTNPFIY